MIHLKKLLLILIGFMALSCGRSSYPCPDLSNAEMKENTNALPNIKSKSNKKGLIKKKGVNKTKRR